MKKIITTLAVVIIIAALSGAVLAATGVVNTEELNLRKEASTNSEAIDGLVKGDEVNIISEENDDWYEVTVDGQKGYVSKQYITKKDENTKTETNTTTDNNVTNEVTTTQTEPVKTQQPVDITNLNKTKFKEIATLHVLPLINSTTLGFIDANTEALLISVNGKWAYIQTSTQSGWVLANKLESTVITLSSTVNTNTSTSTNTSNTENKTNNEPTNTVDNTTSKQDKSVMYVNSESVNVRSESNTDSKVVTTLTKNTEVTITGKEGEWYKVETSKGNGYIKGDLLSENKVEESTTEGNNTKE